MHFDHYNYHILYGVNYGAVKTCTDNRNEVDKENYCMVNLLPKIKYSSTYVVVQTDKVNYGFYILCISITHLIISFTKNTN